MWCANLRIRMKLKSLPQKLYKYRAFNVPSLRLLSEAEIYYSNPKQFNDPMDCDPSIEVDVDPNSLEKLRYKLLISTQTKDKAKDVIYMIRYYSDQYEAYSVDKNAEDCLKRLLAQEIKQLIQKELGTKGVFSLSG